jgi:hypothetical protein
MASASPLWDISYMVNRPERKTAKKAAAERRAAEIHRRLAALRPPELSERQWTIRAGVSPSFFTNLAGAKKSEPSVGNLRSILAAIDVTLPEFFADEAKGRLVPAPTRQALEAAIADALPAMPRAPGRRAAYLAATLEALLKLPQARRAKSRKAA